MLNSKGKYVPITGGGGSPKEGLSILGYIVRGGGGGGTAGPRTGCGADYIPPDRIC